MNNPRYDIMRETLGPDCNHNDEIVIEDFKGVLHWVRGCDGPAAVDPSDPFTSDHNSAHTGVLTLRSSGWSDVQAIPVRLGDELVLMDCIGKRVTLKYVVDPNVFTDAIFVHSNVTGILRGA